MLEVSDSLGVPEREFRFTYVASGGPGGQNVNKRSTKAVLRWHLRATSSIPPDVRDRFISHFGSRLTREGELVLTSDNPYDEDPQQIVSDIRRGISRRGQTRILLDRGEAIASALAAARPGDSVLIAGRGHQKEQIIGGQRYLLDDRQVARDILYFMADSLPNTEVRA